MTGNGLSHRDSCHSAADLANVPQTGRTWTKTVWTDGLNPDWHQYRHSRHCAMRLYRLLGKAGRLQPRHSRGIRIGTQVLEPFASCSCRATSGREPCVNLRHQLPMGPGAGRWTRLPTRMLGLWQDRGASTTFYLPSWLVQRHHCASVRGAPDRSFVCGCRARRPCQPARRPSPLCRAGSE